MCEGQQASETDYDGLIEFSPQLQTRIDIQVLAGYREHVHERFHDPTRLFALEARTLRHPLVHANRSITTDLFGSLCPNRILAGISRSTVLEKYR